MNISHKFKDSAIAIAPIALCVVLLQWLLLGSSIQEIVAFLISAFLVTSGLALFLTGAELGIMPAGSFLGAAITRTRRLPLILVSGLIFGFLITLAEPALLVLGSQAQSISSLFDSTRLVIFVAIGVGIFLAVALARTVFQISYRLIIFVGYALVFSAASFTNHDFLAVAFDAGGATTGPMAVPFIIALGVGVAGVRSDRAAERDSFGFTGIASIGPILAVLALGFFSPQNADSAATSILQDPVTTAFFSFSIYVHALPGIASNVAVSLIPLVVILGIFQVLLLRIPPAQLRRIIIGFFYTYIGLVIFFLGTNTVFMPIGHLAGVQLASIPASWLLIPIGCILGALVVCAEPAIWVLTEQVEEISGGNIRKFMLLGALAIGIAAALGLTMWRILDGFSIWFLLVPCYAVSLALVPFCPPLFTAIAFDSGGVASGPMSSTFLMAFTLGASSGTGQVLVSDGFGLVAMIAVMPIISIQILGILYKQAEKRMTLSKKQKMEADA